tara:strand:- start:393 stop:995 length:603 start_codon:yes stop_codon:yes gene_type:complete
MATTVTPITDQVPTVASWAGMIAALDRGTPDPLSSITDTLEDSVRLSAVYKALTSVSNTTYKNVFSIPVDQGQRFYHRLDFNLSETNADANPNDLLTIRITAPSGVSVYGAIHSMNDSRPLSGVPRLSMVSAVGAAQYISIVQLGGFADDFTTEAVTAWLIVSGTSASGSVTIEIAKGTTGSADTYQILRARSIGRRILG